MQFPILLNCMEYLSMMLGPVKSPKCRINLYPGKYDQHSHGSPMGFRKKKWFSLQKTGETFISIYHGIRLWLCFRKKKKTQQKTGENPIENPMKIHSISYSSPAPQHPMLFSISRSSSAGHWCYHTWAHDAGTEADSCIWTCHWACSVRQSQENRVV